jgi:hypothetical protein
MTRKHYVALAAAMRDVLDGADNGDVRIGVECAIDAVSHVCKADNHRFDYRTFYDACGLE